MNATTQHDDSITFHQESITPFWHKIPSFIVYPLQFGPLVYIGALAMVSVVTVLFGGLFRGLLIYLFLRYAFAVMVQRSRGDLDANSANISTWGTSDYRPLKQTIIFLVYLVALIGLAAVSAVETAVNSPEFQAAQSMQQQAQPSYQTDPRFVQPQGTADDEDDDDQAHAQSQPAPQYRYAEPAGTASTAKAEEPEVKLPAWFYILSIVFALPIPAAMMVIAIEDSLLKALNPLTTLEYIRAMGKGYFILWVFFALIMGAREGVLAILPETMSAFIRVPLETFFSFYFMLALYAMMGYALYQYHQQLGYGATVDFDAHRKKEAQVEERTRTVRSGQPADPLAERVNALVGDGKLDEAIRVLQDAMRDDPLSLPLNERLHKLWMLKEDTRRITDHGHIYLAALFKAGQGAKALVTFKKLKTLEPAFEVKPESILPLASAAFAAREYSLAVELVKGFDKRFPGHADIPGVYFLGAKITSEHLRQDDKAMAILKAIVQRFPDAPVKDEAARYLAVLAGVTKTAAAPAKT